MNSSEARAVSARVAWRRAAALRPVRRGRPVPLELTSAVRIEWVEPSRRRHEAEVCAGRGPAVVLGGLGQAGPDGIHFDVAEGGGPMVVVEDAGEETTLPEMTAKFLGGVAVGGVLAVDVHHEQGDGVRAITGGDEVKVIGQFEATELR